MKQYSSILIILLSIMIIISACGGEETPEQQSGDMNPQLPVTTQSQTNSESPAVGSSDDIQANWWQPPPGTTWQWQLTGAVDYSYDVDMYDVDLFNVSPDEINRLSEEGRTVICYFSAGSWENWRPDATLFPDSLLGKQLEGWPDERWLDIRQIETLTPLLGSRLDLAVEKGCDGVEPDNMDAYANKSGFSLSYEDQLAFNAWLADEAHRRNLSIGLKNDLDQIEELVNSFDWALNEQCFEYNECEALTPFIHAGKAVFGVEYELEPEQFCSQAQAMQFRWMKKNWDLDAWMAPCW